MAENENRDLDALVELIAQWGEDRGIAQNSTGLGQSRKTIEEVHELIEAAAEVDVCRELAGKMGICGNVIAEGIVRKRLYEARDKLIDAIGDVAVTLVQVAGCEDMNFRDCCSDAYNEIKDRKGFLDAAGVFHKESEGVVAKTNEEPQNTAQEPTEAVSGGWLSRVFRKGA